MNRLSQRVKELERQATTVERQLAEHVADSGRLAIIQAPPGSGKTSLLLKTVEQAYRRKKRCAVAAQTNSQADDICRRLARSFPRTPAIRFASAQHAATDLGASITWEVQGAHLPVGHCIVVSTSAKWGLAGIPIPFDYVFVDEAWQLSWADFMLLGRVGERFVLIGDPGQIPPVVSVDVARWETSARPPHIAAPRVVLDDPALRPERWRLPATRRLPYDAAGLVQGFYDFDFGSFAEPGARSIKAAKGGRSAEDASIDRLRLGSVSGLLIPTPDAGPPLERDDDIAASAARLVQRLLHRKAIVEIDGVSRPLAAEDIGLCATHRVMNSALHLALPKKLQRRVVVDTPERWQGLERPLMIVVHPLSGVVRPSSFDLETGRLCVMASRHLAGLVIVSRDHIAKTIDECIPSASQALGRPDVAGRGVVDNLSFWAKLAEAGQLVQG